MLARDQSLFYTMSDSAGTEQVDVDGETTDPIAVSLRASIDDGKTAYRNPDKLDRRSLFEAKSLDIWTSHDDARRLQRAYRPSRSLPADLFEPYHPEAEPDERLMLRLICTRPITSSDEIAWHDDLNFPGHRQINVFLLYQSRSRMSGISGICRRSGRDFGSTHEKSAISLGRPIGTLTYIRPEREESVSPGRIPVEPVLTLRRHLNQFSLRAAPCKARGLSRPAQGWQGCWPENVTVRLQPMAR